MLPILFLLSACNHQYVFIPGATVLEGTPQYYYTNVFTGTLAPTYVVTEGSLDLTVEQSVTVEFSFAEEFEFEVTEFVFYGLEAGDTEFGDHWLYELNDEEIAAKKAVLSIQATATRPTKEVCTPKHLGTWTCFLVADQGVNELGFSAAGSDSLSIPAVLPLTLPSKSPSTPGDDTGDACSAYTADDCCAGGAALECAWDPSCPCPSGTEDIGYYGDGNRRCDCPG